MESVPIQQFARQDARPPGALRVVVVGPCAAGKSTLVRGLKRRGYDARVCAQEHSEVPELWRRQPADVVIALDVDLASLRQRRRADDWPEGIYRQQRRRLAGAFAAADVTIDTTGLQPRAVLRRAVAMLAAHPMAERDPPK